MQRLQPQRFPKQGINSAPTRIAMPELFRKVADSLTRSLKRFPAWRRQIFPCQVRDREMLQAAGSGGRGRDPRRWLARLARLLPVMLDPGGP